MAASDIFGGERWTALLRRFLNDDSAAAGLQYVLFTACWSACVSGGLYLGTPMITTKFEAVSSAMRGAGLR